jgi:predicted SprT family Zn-dependent metalloprotease
LKFKPYDLLCTTQSCKDMIHASKIGSELLFRHYSYYSDTRGVTEKDRKFKWTLLAVLKPNRIICKRIDANCISFHLRVFLGLSNPQGQR